MCAGARRGVTTKTAEPAMDVAVAAAVDEVAVAVAVVSPAGVRHLVHLLVLLADDGVALAALAVAEPWLGVRPPRLLDAVAGLRVVRHSAALLSGLCLLPRSCGYVCSDLQC